MATRKNNRRPTGKHISDLLPSLMNQIASKSQERPDLVLATWPQVIGEKLAPMTAAVSFEEGILTVKVKNSTLYSLLSQHEKGKLMSSLKQKCPFAMIRNIRFRIG